jgi:hypothetical protein
MAESHDGTQYDDNIDVAAQASLDDELEVGVR